MNLTRMLRHLFTSRWSVRRRFDAATLARIEAAIRDVEGQHAGEIRFAVEPALDMPGLLRGETPRERALEVFGLLGVWDTEQNNGVLLYVLLADRDVEILADRGIAQRVAQADWDRLSEEMRVQYRAGRFAEGSVAGVLGVGALLARHFPGGKPDRDELPNQPVLL
jgi:uncharacterized membrane protein